MTHISNEQDTQALKEKFGKHFINRSIDWNEVFEDENGELRCKKCGKPKTKFFKYPEILGNKSEEKRIYVMCDCDKSIYEHERELEREIEKKNNIEQLKDRLNLDEGLSKMNFDYFDSDCDESFTKALFRAKAFVAHFMEFSNKGYGIYLYGNKGVGKTSIMAAMANELIERYQCCVGFFRLQDLFERMKKRREETLDMIKNVSVLFLDDVGTERFVNVEGSDLEAQSMFYDIVSARLGANKPTVFSSNFTIGELEKRRGLRSATADRLFLLSSALVKIEGESYRRKIRTEMIKNIPF